MEVAAGAFGMKLQYLDVLDSNDIANAFRDASKAHTDAVLVLASSVLLSQRTRIIDLVIKNRVPAIYPNGEYVEDGGLMSYGPNIVDLFRRAATYVDKILKGAKPADLPVEQPKKFELIIKTSQTDRSDDTAECGGESRQGDQVSDQVRKESEAVMLG